MKTSSAHHIKAPEWIIGTLGRSASRYAKRNELHLYVAQNLSAGQVPFSHAECVRWAAIQAGHISSAYESMRDSFKAQFSVFRGVYTVTSNPKHFVNR